MNHPAIAATFVSEWDDENVTITCPCLVNTETHRITYVNANKRAIITKDDTITEENVDDMVDNLDTQYVLIPTMNRVPACPDGETGPDGCFYYD